MTESEERGNVHARSILSLRRTLGERREEMREVRSEEEVLGFCLHMVAGLTMRIFFVRKIDYRSSFTSCEIK